MIATELFIAGRCSAMWTVNKRVLGYKMMSVIYILRLSSPLVISWAANEVGESVYPQKGQALFKALAPFVFNP